MKVEFERNLPQVAKFQMQLADSVSRAAADERKLKPKATPPQHLSMSAFVKKG